jgi:hypothetical protein
MVPTTLGVARMLADSKVYRILSSVADVPGLTTSPKWGLPAISCPRCAKTWMTHGVALPSISLEGHPEEESFRIDRLRPVSPEEFQARCDRLKNWVPSNGLRPGADFGPLEGSST